MHQLHKATKMFVLLLLALSLAACGNSAGGSNNSSNTAAAASASPSPSPSASAEVEATTRIVKTLRGDVEVPAKPQRVVTDGYLPEMLVMGIKPIGSTTWELDNKVIQDQIDGIESTGERNLEKILDLKPDVIVTWTSDEKILEQYDKIAPTVSLPYSTYTDIHETLRFLAAAVGQEAAAEQWLTDFDQLVAQERAKLVDIIKPEDTFSLMGVFVVDSGFYIYGDGGYRGGEAIYTHLKLTPPDKQKQEMIGKEAYRQISYEVIEDYAGDYIFLDQGEMISEVWGSNQGLWKSLAAVKNNRVFNLDPELFWGNDPVSLKLQIQEIVSMLTEQAKQN
ncbi:ABC transporter substrate-binding protein [Paenibacillus sp. KS-LC4]|uniref:ABC transporter substrate-binding protein n=1 Tax=Paenibacillus sp. KS-LC4 TaxID=2979727 RepID=UPI0030D2118D